MENEEFVGEISWRRGSTVYFTGDGYHYLTHHPNRTRVYLRCINQDCPGRASMPLEIENRTRENLRVNSPHTCLPDFDFVAVTRLRSRILERARIEVTNYRTIHIQESARVPLNVAARVPFDNSLNQAMFRSRQELQPRLPETLEEYGDILALHDGRDNTIYGEEHFYRGTMVDANGSASVIFASPQLCQHLENVEVAQMDATFKVVPRIPAAYQLLTIMAVFFDRAFPVIWALMERKTIASYDGVFTFVRAQFPGLNPGIIITDFEVALQRSARAAFPGTNIVGCWFHSSNAMLRKARRLGLMGLFQDNLEARRILKMSQALPLLPAHRIQEGYNFVVGHANHHGLLQRMAEFMAYIERVWINGVGAQALSVFGQRRRTNNEQEAYHRILRLRFPDAHPNIWQFTEGLLHIEGSYVQSYSSLARGLDVRQQRRKYILSNQIIVNQSTLLVNNARTTGEFLLTVSHQLDNIHHEIFNAPDSEEDDEEVIGVADGQQQLPIVIPQNRGRGLRRGRGRGDQPPQPYVVPVRGRGVRGRRQRGARLPFVVNPLGPRGPAAWAAEAIVAAQQAANAAAAAAAEAAAAAAAVAAMMAPAEAPPAEELPAAGVILVQDPAGQAEAPPAQADAQDGRCLVCLDAQPDALLRPCLHLIMCRPCAELVEAEALINDPEGFRCPGCREPVLGIDRVFRMV